jgi:hypothetical protein
MHGPLNVKLIIFLFYLQSDKNTAQFIRIPMHMDNSMSLWLVCVKQIGCVLCYVRAEVEETVNIAIKHDAHLAFENGEILTTLPPAVTITLVQTYADNTSTHAQYSSTIDRSVDEISTKIRHSSLSDTPIIMDCKSASKIWRILYVFVACIVMPLCNVNL